MRALGVFLAVLLVVLFVSRRATDQPDNNWATPVAPSSPVPVPSASASPIDGRRAEEIDRSKSTGLEAYEKAAQPIDQKIGLAGVMLTCGLRSNDWYQKTVQALEDYRNGPEIAPMLRSLPENERAQALRFDRLTTDGTVGFNLGDSVQSGEEACRSIAGMPFAQTNSAFEP